MFAVAGLLLTSCVEDKESDTVKAIREAKVKQIESIAEANLIIAQADAAFTLAQVEFQNQETEEAKERFALELQELTLKLTKDLAAINREIREANLNHNTAALGEYTAEVDKLLGYKLELLTKEMEVAALEAGVVSAEEMAAKDILAKEKEIATEEAKIAALTALEGNSKESLRVELETLNAQSKKAADVVVVRNDAYDKAGKAYDKAKDNLDVANVSDAKSSTSATVNAYYKLNDLGYSVVKSDKYEVSDLKTINIYYTLIQSQVLSERNTLQTAIENNTAAIGVNDADAPTGYYAAIKAAVDAVKVAVDAAALLTPADAGYDAAQQAVRAARVAEQVAREDLADAQADLAEDKAELAKFNELVAVFADDKTTYDALFAALKPLAAAEEAANEALTAAVDEKDVVDALAAAVDGVFNGLTDISKEIAEATAAIAAAEKEIAELAEGTKSPEEILARRKQEIVNLKAKIAAQEIVVAIAKENFERESI